MKTDENRPLFQNAPSEEPSRPVLLYPDSKTLPTPGRRRRDASRLTLILADLLVVYLAIAGATWFNSSPSPADSTQPRFYLGVALLSLPAWVVALGSQRLYEARLLSRRVDEMARII